MTTTLQGMSYCFLLKMNINLKRDLLPSGMDLQRNFLILNTGKLTLGPNPGI